MRVFDLGVAPYLEVQNLQKRLRRAVASGRSDGVLLLLEHPPVITLGVRASPADVRRPDVAARLGVEVVRSERGGQSTLHAPGQLVAYPIMRIPRRDLRAYVDDLEQVIVSLLARHGLEGSRSEGRPGVYVKGRKIASIGLRCEHGIASHGTSLNVNVDLNLFTLLSSCGDPSLEQTSIHAETGGDQSMRDFKAAYREVFAQTFGLRMGPPTRISHGRVDTHLLSPEPDPTGPA